MLHLKNQTNEIMASIDLELLIKDSAMSDTFIAKRLFPQNKFPSLALKRVISKEAELSESQITELTRLFGVSYEQLFKKTWSAISNKGIITFKRNGYEVILETNTGLSTVYSENKVIFEKHLYNMSIPIRGYIKKLDEQIEFYENQIDKTL